MDLPVLVRLLTEEDLPWLHRVFRNKYGPRLDADSTEGWFRNICLKSPLLFHAIRTENAFCVTMLSVMPWTPTEWEANVVSICADNDEHWEAIRLLRASIEWSRRRKATYWRIVSETDYDLAPMARRVGAKELTPRFSLRL